MEGCEEGEGREGEKEGRGGSESGWTLWSEGRSGGGLGGEGDNGRQRREAGEFPSILRNSKRRSISFFKLNLDPVVISISVS